MSVSDDHEPVNLLALDGGGVRGVSELIILDEIMREIQRKEQLNYLPKPCDYFHLIGGTSTGGLIAIMLGRLRMSTAEALDEYDNFGKEIFSFRNRKVDLAERFRATRLQETVTKIVEKRGTTELMRDPDNPKKGKAFVCATPAREVLDPRRLRTYEIDDDHWDKDCKIWEAARATAAAPTYFKPMAICGADGQVETFIDAAMGCNNPSDFLLKEAGEIFDTYRKFGCILSLGTGTRSRGVKRASNPFGTLVWMAKMISLMKAIVVDCEATHQRLASNFQGFPETYFRFNVPEAAKKVGTGDHSKMEMLKKMTRDYVQNVAMDDIRKVADVLRRNSSLGLSVGHVCWLNKENIIMNRRQAIPQGTSSLYFTGRSDILKRLDEYFCPLQENGGKTRRQFLLHGMGGVGKTEIALKFVEDHEQIFRTFWVDASDKMTTDQHFKAFAPSLYPAEKSIKDPLSRVLEYFKNTQERWLLVYDNFQDRESWDFTGYIPSGNKGNILFTSRESTHAINLPDECVAHVDVLGEDDSISLLLATAKKPRESSMYRKAAKPVIKELGHLPLAVVQAGAYVAMTDKSLEGYLGEFQARKKELLTSDRYLTPADPRRIAVYTSFDISYNTVVEWAEAKTSRDKAQHARSALQILTMICFYHNEGVMKDMVRRAAEQRSHGEARDRFPLPGDGNLCLEELLDVDVKHVEGSEPKRKWNSERFDTGCRFLHEFALARQDLSGDYISMHVLVHSWAKDTMKDSVREQQSLAARMILLDSITFRRERKEIYYRTRLIPHVMACDKYVTARHSDELLESQYNSKFGRMAGLAGKYETAEQALRRARDTQVELLGEEDNNTLNSQIRLGDVLGELARYEEAQEILEHVLETRIRVLGQDHPKTTSARTSLAALYSHASLIDHTEQILREVLEARTDQLRRGEETMSYWRTRRTLDAIQAFKSGDTRSLQLAEEALVAAERSLEPDDPAIASAKGSVASCLLAREEFKEAEKLYKEVYLYNLELHGKESKETLHSSHEYSYCLFSQGRWLESEERDKDVYQMSEELLGIDHPDTLAYRTQWAASLGAQGCITEALEHLHESSRLMDAKMGPEHYGSIMAKKTIAMLEPLKDQVTPAVKAGLRKKAVHASCLALGDDAPLWMKEEEAHNQRTQIEPPATLISVPQMINPRDEELYD